MNRMTRKFLRKPLASVLKRFFILTNGGYSIGSAYGVRFVFDWRHSLDKKVALELYEHEQISYMCNCLDKLDADMFVDIGSHSGLYSIIAKARHPELEVRAFEPDPGNLYQLHANLFVNGMQADIKVHEHGISNRDGVVSFDTSEESSSRGTRRISGTGNTEIMVKRLDSVLDCKDRVIAIKIDVEGHEYEVVDGAGGFLESNRCFLQVESTPEKFDELKHKLTGLGYRHIKTLHDHYFTNFDNNPGQRQSARDIYHGSATKA